MNVFVHGYSDSLPFLREVMFVRGNPAYEKKSEELIKALPPADDLTPLEIRAVLGEVIYGNLFRHSPEA